MTTKSLATPFGPNQLKELREAVLLLEQPGVFIRAANWIGTPVEKALAKLPNGAREAIQDATRAALEKGLDVALFTLDTDNQEESWDWSHLLGVTATGAIGGFFGLPALVVELPISTCIMLRSIADIARSEGEQLANPEARLACLEVLALGGHSKDDDAAESAYFIVRAAMARQLAKAAEVLAERGLAAKESSAVLRLMATIAERFGLQVEEKALAEALPVVGALGGAALNAAFLDHFQDMARGHFICRRLERSHGPVVVREAYERILAQLREEDSAA